MRLLLIALIAWLFAITVEAAEFKEPAMPALGFEITGGTGSDVLDTMIPELARLGFTELLPRETSTEHLPLAIFRRVNGDEIRVIAGKQCAMLWFSGADVPPGADQKTYGRAYGERFSKVHETLKQYFVRLPLPHPMIVEGEIPAIGMCPSQL